MHGHSYPMTAHTHMHAMPVSQSLLLSRPACCFLVLIASFMAAALVFYFSQPPPHIGDFLSQIRWESGVCSPPTQKGGRGGLASPSGYRIGLAGSRLGRDDAARLHAAYRVLRRVEKKA